MISKYLSILGYAYKQKPKEFEKILAMPGGRYRLYFAKDAATIERSGNSTYPQQIPGSPYYALTNTANPRKRETMKTVLTILGYGPVAITEADRCLSSN